MVMEDILINATEIIGSLPPNILNRFEGLITILQAVGVLFIIYLLYLVISGIVNWKGSRRVKFIEEEVKIIEKKLDLLLERKANKKEIKKRK